MTNEQQLWQLSYLIQEFYPKSKMYQLDEVEERIYFIDSDGDDMQAILNRDAEEVRFQYQQGEDWYDADSATFEQVNEINEVPFL